MKRYLTILFLLLMGMPSQAQESLFDLFGWGIPRRETVQEKPVRLAYDAYFQFDFLNREFARTEGLFTHSGTLFTAALTPSVGVDIRQSDRISHRIMGGIDIARNMGEAPVGTQDAKLENWGLFHEITLYYRLRARLDNTLITAYAGVFPRRFMQGEYSKAFFSDSLLLRDRNLEGALVTIRRPRSVYEFGCDWMGMIGTGRRERFMLFTTGESYLTDWFSLGWALTGYHYACAADYGQVADNILAEPFIKFSLGDVAGIQALTAKLSFLGGMQRLRALGMDFTYPLGGEWKMVVQNWNVGIDNRLYVGTGLMPFYQQKDEAGLLYGSAFYWGDSLYRLHPDSAKRAVGVYDRLEIYYQPHLAGFVDLRLSALFHFLPHTAPYAGCEQRLSLIFDLDRLLHPTRALPLKRKKNTAYNINEVL